MKVLSTQAGQVQHQILLLDGAVGAAQPEVGVYLDVHGQLQPGPKFRAVDPLAGRLPRRPVRPDPGQHELQLRPRRIGLEDGGQLQLHRLPFRVKAGDGAVQVAEQAVLFLLHLPDLGLHIGHLILPVPHSCLQIG